MAQINKWAIRFQIWLSTLVDNNLVSTGVTQLSRWSKLRRLDIPHKVRTFLWRYCRNNVPVKKRLRVKVAELPIICPMCETDVEHMLHVFFDCPFSSSCWQYAEVHYDMSMREFAHEWLLQKLSIA